MARSDDAILQRLLEVQHDALLSEQWDEKTIWRKLFVGCIFREPTSLHQFWVIDALDEAQKFPVFLTLLAQAPSYLRIFLTSRNTPEIEHGLAKLAQVAEHYQIQKEDTLGDFSTFIGSRMENLPAGNDEDREKLKAKILAKASGSFLWVSLVVKKLEQTYSEEGAEEVLNEVPTDMNEVYARMLESVHKNVRAAILARSIFMWMLLSLRPLKVNELQFAVKLDTNQTAHDLHRYVSAICGQLVCVNQSSEVETIHQTAKAYLLEQNTYPDLALNKQHGHTRIAQICLKILAGNSLKGLRPPSMKPISSTLTTGTELTDYACEYFSDHLQKSSPEDMTTWDLLRKFLESNILWWIEYLARKRNLHPVTRTAKNLRVYLRRCAEHLPPLCQKESLETWINDLIRLSTKFGTNLSISPSSIHALIPPMCPPDSIFSKTYASRKPGLLIKGLKDKNWDDCLTRIDYPAYQIIAVAHGDRYSAVAMSAGAIFLYYQDSTQSISTLGHGERARMLAFSSKDQYLASSGLRKVKVWDPAEGTQVWTFDTNHQALTLLFVNDNGALAAATQGDYTVTWNLHEGIETERWQWTDTIHTTAGQQKPHQPPGKALFSPNYATLAVNYRGLPVYLFNIMTKQFIGCCSRETSILPSGTGNHYFVDALAFNPSLAVNILVASYADGELAVYDVESTEIRYRSLDVYAHSLACSPDGRTLVTGSSRGTIQIFEFAGTRRDTLSLIYRINGYEEGIRGIAFSSDSLHFADIRGSQYRIWEPAVLVRNDLDEGNQNELSQAIHLEPELVGMLGGPLEAKITAMCCHPSGDIVFCGKRDGSVAYFNTHTATQDGVLYRHAAKTRITCMAYSERRRLLITADESGRVLINNVSMSQTGCEVVALVAEIRSEVSAAALLPDASGTRILIKGMRSAEAWTTEGEKVGFSIPIDDDDDRTIINHPLDAEYFVSIGHKDMRIYSWADALEAQPFIERNIMALSRTATPPSPGLQRGLQPKCWPDLSTHSQSSRFIINLLKGSPASTSCYTSTALQVWPASSISVSKPYPQPNHIPDFNNHVHKVHQIVGMTGSQLLFLDTDLWVCSLNMTRVTSSAHEAKRHFFLLSEWQSSDRVFKIEYMPVRREFVVARKDGILVISRGLEFEEPWLAS
jgi:WD40 repeat protein